MTRPPMEPTDQRRFAQLGFTTDQLLRRPSSIGGLGPGGPFDISSAARIMAGVFDSDQESDEQDGNYYGASFWPGGVICQTLAPEGEDVFLGPAASVETDSAHAHQLLPGTQTVLVTQSAANEAAADICVEFELGTAAGQIPLQTVMLPHPLDSTRREIDQTYTILLAIKLLGTPRNVSFAVGRNGTYGSTSTLATSGSGRWGLGHWGLYEISLSFSLPNNSSGLDYFEEGDSFQLKIWADNTGAEMRLALMYWIPDGDGIGPTDTTGHYQLGSFFMDDYLAAHASTISSTLENNTAGGVIASTQYVSGLFDAAYEVSCGGNSDNFVGNFEPSFYTDNFEAARTFEARYAYQEARINMDDRTEDNVAFAALYKDSFPFRQAPIHSQDWGLIYWGPWHHDWANLHWGLWAPRDITNGGTVLDDYPFDDAAFNDIRIGNMWFPRAIFHRPLRYVDWP